MDITIGTILYIIGGIVIGWFLSFIKSRFEIRVYKKEIKEYQNHLNRQMKITNEGSKNLESELVQLKKENENLRISVQTLGQKPGRAEVRLLNIYDSALRKMMLNSPGFSSVWEMSLQEAESEYELNEKGFKSIIKKVFSPSLGSQNEANLAEVSQLSEGLGTK
jgi:Fe-S cluster assembly iron-binding protein IscA